MGLMTDEKAREVAKGQTVTGEIYGTPIPDGQWVGQGALDEFRDGKGPGNDDK